MNSLLIFFIIIPLLGLVIGLVTPRKNEKLIAQSTFGVMGLHWFATLFYLAWWAWKGFSVLHINLFSIYTWKNYNFFIDLFFDKTSAVYLFVGSLLSFMVTIYSRYYLRHEKGYKRFFNTILFFFLGYNIVIFSGNFETMFIGWEILGVSSFLLIAFYRERFLPVKNAFKVFSIYRLGDAAFILSMWLSHHLWEKNITFYSLQNYDLVHEHLQNHTWVGIILGLSLLVAAAVKSAQLPFSSWLARAMEGPTPSSAIFYGSLSVHMGVFLMLRTFPFWEQQVSLRLIIGLLGFLTSVISTFIARTQATIKGQIAYASISQIGVIFIELSLGLEYIALFHFAGNAFLRTYQFLISPSVVTYLIREQFYNYVPKENKIEQKLPQGIRHFLYVLSLKEWNLDSFMYVFLWRPLKVLGLKFSFLDQKITVSFLILIYFTFAYFASQSNILPLFLKNYLPIIFAFIAFLLVIRAFVERKNAILAWFFIAFNHLWVALSIAYNDTLTLEHLLIYLSGIAGAGFLGMICLLFLKQKALHTDMDSYYGYSDTYSLMDKLFLLAVLGMAGFPISPTFLGIDLIFGHIQEAQILLSFMMILTFIMNGISVIRIYARLFLGKESKAYESEAYRSS